MEILSKTSDSLARVYTVSIQQNEIESAIAERLKEVSKQIRLDGFRPGKVPVDVVKRMYGDSVNDEAKKNLISDISQKIIKDEKFVLLSRVLTDILKEDDNGIEFSMSFEIAPDIELKDFSNIELVKHTAKITKKEIDESLSEFLKYHKNWIDESADAKIEHGHKVIVDFEMKPENKKNKPASAKDISIMIGSPDVIEDFWKPLLGLSVSDTKEFVVNYPENLRDKTLAGKSIKHFAVIKKILKSTDYALDDVFAESLGYKNLNELSEHEKTRVIARYELMSKEVLKRDLLEKLSDLYDFNVPNVMLSVESQAVKRQIREEAEKLGKEMTEEIEKECDKLAQKRVMLGFIVSAIAKKEKINVSNDEISKSIESIARMYPGQEKMIWDSYSKGDGLRAVISPLLEKKVVDFLLGIVKVKDVDCSVSELIALDEEEFEFFKNSKDVKEKKQSKSKRTDEDEAKAKPKAKKTTKNSEKE